MAIELVKVTTPAIPGQTIGEATGTFDLDAGQKMELAHWAPGKVTDLSEEPPDGKHWFVTVHIHVVETDDDEE